jgi:hypothetical protein
MLEWACTSSYRSARWWCSWRSSGWSRDGLSDLTRVEGAPEQMGDILRMYGLIAVVICVGWLTGVFGNR